MILETIRSRDDLLRLTKEQDRQLCAEIREFLVQHVAQTGGHLASNLGIVETTLAIQKVFDTSRDRLVFDVGHQSYVHKILTGRMEQFGTLRTFGGISGFPKPSESVHDAFIAGHASNAVSVALGMARARTLRNEDYNVIALMGDGALTGGLAYEGLNNAGASREPMIVILNDNGMSITPNVGAISRYLAQVRLRPGYFGLKLWYRSLTSRIPGGRKLYRFTHRVKARMHRRLIGTTLFEQMGFTYLGPVDGHNTERIAYLLNVAKALREPVLLHLITQKGKGYEPAEDVPEYYHGVGKFDPANGRPLAASKPSFSGVFGETLLSLAKEDERICAVTAAMQHGTGLDHFAHTLPQRFFDVGIAEGHAVAMSAGLAKQGMLPVAAVYSTFLQRAFDMILHDVALQQLHVVLAVDHAGLVGEDGETHQGMFDVGYLRQVPGMVVYSPASHAEMEQMLRAAIYECKGPAAIRYPRGSEGAYRGLRDGPRICEGTDCTVLTYGSVVNSVLELERLCRSAGISLEILKPGVIAPLDFAPIFESVKKTGRLLVIEECADHGCLADEIFAELACRGIPVRGAKRNLGSAFIPHGSVPELYKLTGLDADSLYPLVLEVMQREK